MTPSEQTVQWLYESVKRGDAAERPSVIATTPRIKTSPST